MARVGTPGTGRRPPPPGTTAGDHPGRLRLLRNSHIFASTVQDILQGELLRRSSSVPLTPSQLHLLKLMERNGTHTLGEAADFLGVSLPTASKHVDKLESSGLVLRARSKGDRRVTLLSVTPDGRAVVERYDELTREQLGAALAGFDPGEVEWLSSLLERLSISLLEDGEALKGNCLRCAAYLSDECAVGELRGGCPYGGSAEYTSTGGAEDYG